MNNQIQSRSPLKQKMVMGVTYCFGIGQVLVAMVPLGVAAYVEFYRLEKNVPLSSAVGLSAHLGKFFVIAMYNLENLKPISYMISENLLNSEWWRDLPYSIQKTDKSFKGITVKSLKFINLFSGIVPGLTFAFLTERILDDFIPLVHETKPGRLFDIMTEYFERPWVKRVFQITSFNSNFICAPAVMGTSVLIIKGLYGEWKSITTPYQEFKFTLGLLGGMSITIPAMVGYYSFYPVSKGIGEDFLFMSDTEATAFGVTQYAYIVILTFITAFPLGKAIVEIALDIVTGQYQWPAKLQLLANMLLGLCTLAICVLGGLPNVWQANYENKDPWLAEFASAVTELVGTYILLGIITTQMALLMGALIRCCLAEPPNNQYEKEILVNDDELNNKFPEQRATWNKAHSTPSSRNRWYFFCCGKPRVEGYKKMADQSDDLEGPEDHGFS